MTKKTNIQIFDEITAELFARLYDSFPLPIGMDCLKLTNCECVDEFGKASHEADICVATIQWLEASEYLKVQKMMDYGATEMVLTVKGLSVLKSMPESLESKTSLGERISNAIKAGAIPTAVDAVKLVFAVAGKS